MKTIRLFSLELGRLLRSRLTWLVILLTAEIGRASCRERV